MRSERSLARMTQISQGSAQAPRAVRAWRGGGTDAVLVRAVLVHRHAPSFCQPRPPRTRPALRPPLALARLRPRPRPHPHPTLVVLATPCGGRFSQHPVPLAPATPVSPADAAGWRPPLMSGADLKAGLAFGQAGLRDLIRRYRAA